MSHDLKHPRQKKAAAPGAGPTRTAPGSWTVSTRTIGEVLTTEIRCDELRLLLFACPDDETARRIEARLEALTAAGAAREGSAGVVPVPLARAVDVLAGLVEELGSGPRRRAGAVAFYQSGREVACACIGGGDPDVWSGGQPFDAPWLELLPADAAGDGAPRARGFSLFVRPGLDMRLRWPYLLGTPKPEGAIVDARWRAPHGFEVTVHALGTPDAGDAPVDEPAVQTGAFFDGWFSDLDGDLSHDPDDASHVAIEAAPADAAIPRATADPVRAAAEPARTTPIAFPDLVEELRAEAERDVDGALPGAAAENESPPANGAVHGAAADETTPGPWQYAGWHAAPATPDPAPAPSVAVRAVAAEPVVNAQAPVAAVPVVAPVVAVEPAAVAAAEPAGAPAASRAIRRPEWPAAYASRPFAMPPWVAKAAAWAAFVAVLFAFGWWLGTRGERAPVVSGSRAPFPVRALRAVGLASPRFALELRSNPTGAAVAVDGRPTPYRTPATVELPPGAHRVTFTLPGGASYVQSVNGRRGATVPLEVSLLGTLHVGSPGASTPVAVTLDGEDHGWAPVDVTGLVPGAHELEFRSPGQPPWSQTVVVPAHGDVRITARPFDLPASGVIHVTATMTDDEGSRDLRGATVLVDGERRGTTPLDLELPRGPHSVRAEYRGESVPVQVIDLPGGNERYAGFTFGTGGAPGGIVLRSPLGPVAPAAATPVTVSLPGLMPRDVREIWLHVRAPDGAWKRYAMTLLDGDTGVMAATVFPAALLDARGDAPFYVSALATTGEEYFTDIRSPAPKPVVKPKREPRVHLTPATPPAQVAPATTEPAAAAPPPATPDAAPAEPPTTTTP